MQKNLFLFDYKQKYPNISYNLFDIVQPEIYFIKLQKIF